MPCHAMPYLTISFTTFTLPLLPYFLTYILLQIQIILTHLSHISFIKTSILISVVILTSIKTVYYISISISVFVSIPSRISHGTEEKQKFLSQYYLGDPEIENSGTNTPWNYIISKFVLNIYLSYIFLPIYPAVFLIIYSLPVVWHYLYCMAFLVFYLYHSILAAYFYLFSTSI